MIDHTGTGKKCKNAVTVKSLRIELTYGPFTFSREYATKREPEYKDDSSPVTKEVRIK